MVSHKGILAALCVVVGFSFDASAGVVDIHDNQLFIDGHAQPQLYGAEIQYFRLRDGLGKNRPREEVVALWNRVLDRAVEAHMNAVSFYIPWDFHEYAEGKFDFDGTADEDGDGKPDYPSRDVKTFIKLILDHGIHNILVRPGPYVNAEWGFLGFGAIPMWFHDKFPDSHAQNPQGLHTTMYSYRDPRFLAASKNWLRTVYAQVLQPYIGPGKPMSFLQLDNETNFQWSSIYMHDYSDLSKIAYREFLKKRYVTLGAVNAAHETSARDWNEIQPPITSHLNLGEDQDWYRFADDTLHDYLHQIRQTWEEMGVREPNVLFTLAESYNAFEDGLLPNPTLRNDRGVTGMMTVNLYPKTDGTAEQWLFDEPFKADHDVKAADNASDNYLGSQQDWVMGPEIQGGWWTHVEVSSEARRQTYLTTIGHGLKALFIYYFNEGQNWQTDWGTKQIQKIYDRLHQDPRYAGIAKDDLPNEFWGELDQMVGRELFVNWSARWLLDHGTQDPVLRFDAPVGGDGVARAPFDLVREIGEKVVAAHGDFLASATEYTDSVCLIKDPAALVPSPIKGLRSQELNSDWAAGLLGYLMQAGINPRILHWNWTDRAEFDHCRLIVAQDSGFTTPALNDLYRSTLQRGGGVFTLLHDASKNDLFPNGEGCTEIAMTGFSPVSRCLMKRAKGNPGVYYHVKDPIYAPLNSTQYGHLLDVPARRQVLDNLLRDLNLRPLLGIKGGGDRQVVFGRLGADHRTLWATAKSAQTNPSEGQIVWSAAELATTYRIEDVFTGQVQQMSGAELRASGFHFALGANGSTAFFIAPMSH